MKSIEKIGSRYIISESVWKVLKALITGKADIKDIEQGDSKIANELQKTLKDLDDWSKKKHPDLDMTWGEYVSEKSNKIRKQF
ncbi:MAG: hypothetical protein KJ587_19780 [Alphaproteobacteria bacterium]|nr:hypothetical protein [Alphaproteobacteria bacterium]